MPIRQQRIFAKKLADIKSEIDDIKQSRPPSAAITKVMSVTEAGIGLSDRVSITTTTDPVFRYNDADRGYGYAEWANEYPDEGVAVVGSSSVGDGSVVGD